MTQRKTGQVTDISPQRGSGSGGRWRIGPRLAGLMVAVALLGIGGAVFWWRPAGNLPALPALAAQRSELGSRLAAAQAKAASRSDRPAGLAELGRLYHANGFNREAAACWEMLSRQSPTEARWFYYRADLCRSAADADGQRAMLAQTVQVDSSYAPAWLGLAELEFKNGRLEPAEQAYRRRIALVPGDPYGRLGLARLLLQSGRRAEGRGLIEAIVREVPDFPSAHNVFAEILAQEGDSQGAANQRWFGTVAGRFRAADDPWLEELHVDCYDPSQLLVWGAVDLQTKHGDRGKELFDRAIQLEPGNPRGYESVGNYYLETGNPGRARDAFERGTRLPGASEQLFVGAVRAHLALKSPTEALRVARQGLAAIPDSADLLNSEGLVLDALGRTDEAMAAYRASSAQSPGAVDPVANLGIGLLRQGHREEAYAAFRRALEIQPMYPKALTMLVRFELEAGRLQEAAKYVFPFFEQYPGLRMARDLMARFYLRQAVALMESGDQAGAERACRSGLGIVPEAAELYGFLGVLLSRQNRLPEALDLLEKAHRLQPTEPRVALALGQVLVGLGRLADARRALAEANDQATKAGDSVLAAQARDFLQTLPSPN